MATKISSAFVLAALFLSLAVNTEAVNLNALNGVIKATLHCSRNITGDVTAPPLSNVKVTVTDGGRPGTNIVAQTSSNGNLFINFTLGAIFLEPITEINQLINDISRLTLITETPIANCSVLAGVDVVRASLVLQRILSGTVYLNPLFTIDA